MSVQPGNVYCMDALSLLRQLPDASVSLMATDPPFNIGKADWDSWPTVADYLDWLDAHLVEMRRVLKPNGSLYLFASPRLAAQVEIKVGQHFNVLNEIVWKKPFSRHNQSDKDALRGYFPQTERIIFAEQYDSDGVADAEAGFTEAEIALKRRLFGEPIAAAIRATGDTAKTLTEAIGAYGAVNHGGAVSNWILGMNVPTPEQYQKMREYLNAKGGDYLRREYEDLRREYEDLRREYEDLRRPFYASADSPYTDVWEFATVNTYPGKHICEKPLEMMRHIVRVSSRPGDLVCDPFVGSGQTTRAAFIEGRQYIGGDADAKWAARADYYSKLPVQLELLQFVEMVG